MQEHLFSSREQASMAAAEHIASAVEARLERDPSAAFVVSGGTSPVQCFEALSRRELRWQDVTVLLSDERWIEPGNADSNERLVSTTLLTGNASAGQLLGIYDATSDPDSRCRVLNEAYRRLPLPLACSLLGMGEDGHFASLFPDAADLAAGLATDNEDAFLSIETTASPYTRISMSLAALSNADSIALLFFGAAKRAVFDRARDGDPGLPVASLLRQQRSPVHLFWAE